MELLEGEDVRMGIVEVVEPAEEAGTEMADAIDSLRCDAAVVAVRLSKIWQAEKYA